MSIVAFTLSWTCFFHAEMDGKIYIVFVAIQTLFVMCLAGISKVYNIIKSLLYYIYYSFSNIEFVEFPSAATVSENQEALFRCRHNCADSFIVWQINELPSTQYLDVVAGSIEESDGTIIVPTLTIPAIPAYNGSAVVCVAFVGATRETTPPVTLTITGQLVVMYITATRRSALSVWNIN